MIIIKPPIGSAGLAKSLHQQAYRGLGPFFYIGLCLKHFVSFSIKLNGGLFKILYVYIKLDLILKTFSIVKAIIIIIRSGPQLNFRPCCLLFP